MHRFQLADSATNAAWFGAIGQWVAAAATVLAVVVALHVANRDWKRAEGARRAAERERLAAVVSEVLAAVGTLETALESYRMRWADWSGFKPTAAGALADIVDADSPVRRLGAAVRAAARWNQASEDAAELALIGPSTRLTAALVNASLSNDRELRNAANELREDVADRLGSFASKRDRSLAASTFQQAIGRFRATADKIVDSNG